MNSITKIAFVGTHGVGKTTLVEELRKALDLSEDNVIEETAARVFKMGETDPALKINQGATLEAQLKIIGMQIEEEQQKEENLRAFNGSPALGKLLLCDRTAFDAIVYTHARTFRDDKYLYARNIAPHLFDWVARSVTNYDLVFYLPISFPLASSDVRPGDQVFQEEMDAYIQDLFIRHRLADAVVPSIGDKIKSLEILSGSVERRVAIAKKKILETVAAPKSSNYATISGQSLLWGGGGTIAVPCTMNNGLIDAYRSKVAATDAAEHPVDEH